MRSQRVLVMTTDKRRDTAAYWEARLQRMDLDMGRGHVNWIDYGHDITQLDTDGRKTYESTDGERTEIAEWPQSLM